MRLPPSFRPRLGRPISRSRESIWMVRRWLGSHPSSNVLTPPPPFWLVIGFLSARTNPTYEEWIADLHPEVMISPISFCDASQPAIDIPPHRQNARGSDDGDDAVDTRFYVTGSDHLLMWNEVVGQEDAARQVEVRGAAPT